MSKKNKGFTLIELLAVIVILAIVAVISVPIILNIIENVEMGALKSSVKSIDKAAELMYAKEKLKGNQPGDIVIEYENGEEFTNIAGVNLEYKGKHPDKGRLIVKQDGNTQIIFHDGKYCAMKIYGSNDVEVEKKTTDECIGEIFMPSIFLSGPSDVEIELYSIYEEYGYNALTSLGAPTDEVSLIIYKGGEEVDFIDTSVLATYTIVYRVFEGSKIRDAVRTVTIVDKIAPVINVPENTSINIDQVDSFDLLDGVTVTDNSGEQINVIASGSLSRIAGSYIITYSATDSSGNMGTATRVINVIDEEAPVITLNGNSTINLLVGETYIEQGATAVDDADGDLTSSIVITSNVNTAVRGTYYVTYTVVDSSGNESNATRTVVVDREPLINPSIVPSTTEPTTGSITVTIIYNNSLNIPRTYKIDNGAWQTYTGPITLTSNQTVYARVTNDVDEKIVSLKIRNIIPSGWIAIKTPAELYGVRNNLTANYIMMNDINLSGTAYATWEPIIGFRGKFDGNDYKINAIRTTNTGVNNVGLFGTITTNNVEIKNLELTGLDLRGASYIGGIAGYVTGSNLQLSNIKVSGMINGSSYIGGLVGNTSTTININNSNNNASISGTSYVAGLVGYTGGLATVNNSSNTGIVNASSTYSGGLIGYAPSGINFEVVSNTKDINGQQYSGGLVGRVGTSAIINDATQSGNVGSGSSYKGGLIGGSDASVTINLAEVTGTVTGNSSYVGGLVGSVSGNITITNSGTTKNVVGTTYTGGLVGYTSSLTTITGSYARGTVSGGTNVGGLIGRTTTANVTSSYATGAVTGSSDYVGGLIGYITSTSTSTKVLNSYATGNVQGTVYVGGLIGDIRGGNVEKSYASGTVRTTSTTYITENSATAYRAYVGGLIGRNQATLLNVYALGDITAHASTERTVGGLVGYNTGNVTNAYSIGKINGASTNSFIGPIIGENAGGSLTASYWDRDTSLISTGNFGLGRTTVQMQTQSNYSNWNFTTVWQISANEYPKLR